MDLAVCIVPVAPVRRTPAHESEMISQLLFGEACVIHEAAGNGALRVSCLHDGYGGFCMGNQLLRVDSWDGPMLFSGWSNPVACPDGSLMQVPFGAYFPVALRGLYKALEPNHLSVGPLPLAAAFSLYGNTPYLWGGRSVFGADCSGFTQTVMKAAGLALPRDASQQEELGEEIGLADAREGDLAFFDLEGRVVHVGICLGDGGIIHAFGKVRKDRLDQRGILNGDTGAYSHSLYRIKRLNPHTPMPISYPQKASSSQ